MVTRKEIEKLLGIGQTTSGRLLKKMMENGQLIQKGKGKTTHYQLSK
jgi:ATP-dependent DNA helicase RecG